MQPISAEVVTSEVAGTFGWAINSLAVGAKMAMGIEMRGGHLDTDSGDGRQL